MRSLFWVASILGLSACTGTADIGPSGRDGEPSIAFAAPEVGELATRDELGELGGRIAAVDVRLEVSGLARVELWVGLERLASVEVAGTNIGETVGIERTGNVTLEARGLDEGDNIVVTADVDLTIDEPVLDCVEWLDFYGLAYSAGPVEPGIGEPVTVSMPLVGLAYRSGAGIRDEMLGDCALILALADATGMLRRRGVVEVADFGVYNYRCIGGGAPPDCPNGISQHAYANAIDIAGYTTSDGTTYSVNDDWIIDADGDDTCSASTEAGKDTFLHEIICAQKEASVWNIVLTPNYNAAHRDHFHVDLTPDSDFIR